MRFKKGFDTFNLPHFQWCPVVGDQDRAAVCNCGAEMRELIRIAEGRLIEAAVDAYEGQYSVLTQHNLVNATRELLARRKEFK